MKYHFSISSVQDKFVAERREMTLCHGSNVEVREPKGNFPWKDNERNH